MGARTDGGAAVQRRDDPVSHGWRRRPSGAQTGRRLVRVPRVQRPPRGRPCGPTRGAVGADVDVGSDPKAEDQECRNNRAVVLRLVHMSNRLRQADVQPVNAAVPFGTPSPDGPSYPVVPVQR
ncbi:hypothetical protein GCM10010276_31320 [Streptomyces longisporus]|uniref:Uncharacterized protein n=1 Tax=Streptomyces longisporus TaxID=1948 RepID=A0ABN3LTL0_STRLO